MDYISTRDASAQPRSFTDILLTGLSPDGGLFMPAVYPSITPDLLSEWRELLLHDGYAALAAEVLKLYVDDIPEADLEAIARRAYRTPVFADEEIVPVTRLNDQLHIGHLSEGPTAAFKDMAMQLLGELFEYELARRGEEINILGATSGDTGSSAEYAMRGRDGIRVFMLTPAGRMTPFQQAQMFGLNDPNIFNIALDGVFDDCQDVVKAVSADAAFKSKYSIGAVNSINFARLLAQVVYYIATYLKVTESNDERVSFCVPTGNFGNVCAGHIAKQMGLPIARLVIATNENDILARTLETGRYEVRGVTPTSSPSMDIQVSSNFERLLFDAGGRDAAAVRRMMASLDQARAFTIDPPTLAAIRADFDAERVSEAETASEIAQTWREARILIDPHTAVGMRAATRVLHRNPGVPVVVAATAHPAKFRDAVTAATGQHPSLPAHLADLLERKERYDVLANDIGTVERFIREHARAAAPAR